MSHQVELVRSGGRSTAIEMAETETVLDGAEAADLSVPFGCRTGACGTCTGRLVEGRVEHRSPPRALKDRHRQAGYVLTCLAEPRSACRLQVGRHVVRELVSNPFE